MEKITVLPGSSLKQAIVRAFAKLEPGPYQLEIVNTPGPRIANSSGIHKVSVCKIRVSYKNGRWAISEFVFAMDGSMVPVPHRGDFELLDEFEALAY